MSVGSLRRHSEMAVARCGRFPTGRDPVALDRRRAATRSGSLAPGVDDLPTGSGPLVLVALGTFLSARADVLVDGGRRGARHLAPRSRLGEHTGRRPRPAPARIARACPPAAGGVARARRRSRHPRRQQQRDRGLRRRCPDGGAPDVDRSVRRSCGDRTCRHRRRSSTRTLSPSDSLRSAVRSVLSSDATERVSAIARSIADHGGPSVAVDAITR